MSQVSIGLCLKCAVKEQEAVVEVHRWPVTRWLRPRSRQQARIKVGVGPRYHITEGPSTVNCQ